MTHTQGSAFKFYLLEEAKAINTAKKCILEHIRFVTLKLLETLQKIFID